MYPVDVQHEGWGEVGAVLVEGGVGQSKLGWGIGEGGAGGRGEIHRNRGAVGLCSQPLEEKSAGEPGLTALDV